MPPTSSTKCDKNWQGRRSIRLNIFHIFYRKEKKDSPKLFVVITTLFVSIHMKPIIINRTHKIINTIRLKCCQKVTDASWWILEVLLMLVVKTSLDQDTMIGQSTTVDVYIIFINIQNKIIMAWDNKTSFSSKSFGFIFGFCYTY